MKMKMDMKHIAVIAVNDAIIREMETEVSTKKHQLNLSQTMNHFASIGYIDDYALTISDDSHTVEFWIGGHKHVYKSDPIINTAPKVTPRKLRNTAPHFINGNMLDTYKSLRTNTPRNEYALDFVLEMN